MCVCVCVLHSSDRRKAIFFAFPFLPWNSRYQIHHILLVKFYLSSCFIHHSVAWFFPEDDPERFEICWRHNVLYIKLYTETFVHFVVYIL